MNSHASKPATPVTKRIPAGLAGIVVTIVMVVAACESPVEAHLMPPPLAAKPFVVSSPVASTAEATHSTLVLSSTNTTLVYVSLPPNSIPSGTAASIRDVRTASSITVPIVEGGFDPVPLPALQGDTIVVSVVAPSPGGKSYAFLVPAHAVPVVIRTSPPPHKRDVPLNARIVVVFSEPMDSASLSIAVKLKSGLVQQAGSVVIPDILQAEFVPDLPLAPGITYQLQIGTAAKDAGGDALIAPVQFDFTISALPPDATAPIITVLGPLAGDTVPIGYTSLTVNFDDDRQGPISCELFDEVGGLLSSWPPGCFIGAHMLMNIDPYPGPGTHTIHIQARDATGNIGYSTPLTLTFVDPDTSPRIVVRSFAVLEFLYPEVDGSSYTTTYAPQLLVADAPGQQGVEIVGFELLDIPGAYVPDPPWWRLWANNLVVPPGQDVQLFGLLYGWYAINYSTGQSWSGFHGGQATARLIYRDGGHFYGTTLRGPIVPGVQPSSTPGGDCFCWLNLGTYDPRWLGLSPELR